MELSNQAPTFWRKIKLNAMPGYVVGEVEDNVHYFTVSLSHDESSITAVHGSAIRFPWTTCPGAIDMLTALVGTSVLPNTRADVDQAHQCTHLLDLAKLAIAQIARGGQRRYDILVHNGDTDDTCSAIIERDSARLFEWQIREGTVLSPKLFEGHCVEGRAMWQQAVQADSDLREAALVLRRSVFIFRSRTRSQPAKAAGELNWMSNACFSFQSKRVAEAIRPPGFSELETIPQDLLSQRPIVSV